MTQPEPRHVARAGSFGAMKSLAALGLIVLASTAPHRPARPPAPEGPREARDAILDFHAEWDVARVAFDRAALERRLAPEFRLLSRSGDLSRDEFLALVSRPAPGARLTRFHSRLLTLRRDGEVWEAVVEEKLEAETRGADGEPALASSLWITRDRFRPGEPWTVLSSEELGSEFWAPGEDPPFDDWK